MRPLVVIVAFITLTIAGVVVAVRLRRPPEPPVAPAGSWEPADGATG